MRGLLYGRGFGVRTANLLVVIFVWWNLSTSNGIENEILNYKLKAARSRGSYHP